MRMTNGLELQDTDWVQPKENGLLPTMVQSRKTLTASFVMGFSAAKEREVREY